MNSTKIRVVIIAIAAFTLFAGYARLAAPSAYAGTGTVTTDDQQWVSQTAPNATNCTQWSSVNGSSTAKKRTEVSFNTAGVVPAGNTVTAATLRVYPKANYSGNNLSVKSYTRTGTITCNVTWNNLGTVGSQVGISSGSFTKNTYKSITLDPTSINVSGRTAFVLDASAATLMEFRSDASGALLNPTKLDLTWTTTPQPPTVTTNPASGVDDHSASLQGTVNPNGSATTCHFDWGLTTGYGSVTPNDTSPGSGTSSVPVSSLVSGLSANTLYHFRLSCTNANGTTNGSDQSFTTSSGCSPGTPITISTGGTYSGCYVSTDSATPAVSIATGSAVTLSHAAITHKGMGIYACCAASANLTVTDSTITASDPGTPVEQLSAYAYMPASFIFEHNQVTDGHGVLVNGNNSTTSPFSVSNNNYTNVGRYDAPACCIGPVHTDKVLAPGGVIQWNRSTATYGSSLIEDAFGLFQTNGSSSDDLLIAHNLVNGAYPHSGDGADFTGGAFDFGDGGGSYLTGQNNYAVNYTNNAFMIPSGSHITHKDSKATYDGWAGSGTSTRVSSTFGAGATAWHNPGYPTTDNDTWDNVDVSHLRWNGSSWERSDYYFPEVFTGTSRINNDSLATPTATLEESLVSEYEASVTAASQTIGPRP